ncbi:MAG: tetratricopeptide repeat protein [Acidobacteriota bacterium]
MARLAIALAAALTAAVAVAVAQQPDFEPLYRQALEEREQSLGKDAAKTIESARDLGLYLASRGEYAKAAAYLEPALATADTAAQATALHNWAVALKGSEAERLYRKALAIREKALPPLDVELATTRLNLAELVLERDPAEAGRLAAAALVSFEKKLGPMDARTGAACGVIGAVLATKGDVAGSERMFRRALTIAEKAHGPKAPQTASALENLADLLAQTGRELSARPLLDRAQKIRAGTR